MKTALGAFTALSVGGALYVQPAHDQVQAQPALGSSFQIGPEAPQLWSWILDLAKLRINAE